MTGMSAAFTDAAVEAARRAVGLPQGARVVAAMSATDHAELNALIARLDRRLAASGHGRKVAAE